MKSIPSGKRVKATWKFPPDPCNVEMQHCCCPCSWFPNSPENSPETLHINLPLPLSAHPIQSKTAAGGNHPIKKAEREMLSYFCLAFVQSRMLNKKHLRRMIFLWKTPEKEHAACQDSQYWLLSSLICCLWNRWKLILFPTRAGWETNKLMWKYELV